MEKKSKPISGFNLIATILMISGAVSAASLYGYDKYYLANRFPKISTVDVKGYMEKQKQMYVAGEIDEAALEDNINGFYREISNMSDNTIVLLKEVVLKNAGNIKKSNF